jgi:hypothetical protein
VLLFVQVRAAAIPESLCNRPYASPNTCKHPWAPPHPQVVGCEATEPAGAREHVPERSGSGRARQIMPKTPVNKCRIIVP